MIGQHGNAPRYKVLYNLLNCTLLKQCALRAASQDNCAAYATDVQDGDVSSKIDVTASMICSDDSLDTCKACPISSLQQGICYPGRYCQEKPNRSSVSLDSACSCCLRLGT